MRHSIPLERKDAPEREITLEDLSKAIDKHAKATQAVVDEQKSTIEKQADKIAELSANLFEVEQKMGEKLPGGVISGARDLGSEHAKNPLVQQLAVKQIRDAGVEVKASDLYGFETKNTVTNNDGDFFATSPIPGIYGGLERRRFIFDFLRKVVVTGGTAVFTRELTFSNNAAVQAAGSPLAFTEGADKPESEITFELVEKRLQTRAHFIKASNQVLADAPTLRAHLEGRLRYGLRLVTDAAIVSEMTTSGNYTAFTPSSGDDGIASVNRAIATLESQDAMATLICMNPLTYRSLQRLRATGGNAQHIIGQPQGVNRESLWNVPVLPTNAVTAGKLLVIDTETLGDYVIREEAQILYGYVGDDFKKNITTILGESRGDLCVARPVSIVYGDLIL